MDVPDVPTCEERFDGVDEPGPALGKVVRHNALERARELQSDGARRRAGKQWQNAAPQHLAIG